MATSALILAGYFLAGGGSIAPVLGQAPAPLVEYHIYAGNTHAHTAYTWSHGEQWVKPKQEEGQPKEPGIFVSPEGAQFPAESLMLKPDWKKYQGSPAEHFAKAKAQAYDFYAVTDHSQEADFQPPRPNNANWLATKQAAADASDERFVALRGYEHSENNGPGGKGHYQRVQQRGISERHGARDQSPLFL